MQDFIRIHGGRVTGVLSGWDRIRFRGSQRMLAHVGGMMTYLSRAGVLLVKFGDFVQRKSTEMKVAVETRAKDLDRPVIYVASSQTDKEGIAKEIAKRDGIRAGLVCVLSAVEPCMSYQIKKDPERKKLVLRAELRKCLHLYGYMIDNTFGWMSIRLQTWFPFTVQVCVNGREWLARQLDQAGIAYERRDNCFASLSNVKAAQDLMDRMNELNWPDNLERVVRFLNPLHGRMTPEWPLPTYWSAQETEWATDVMFKSEADLGAVYPALVRGAIQSFSSPDVMRFLGKKLNGHFKGEIQSSYKKRPEGVRVKHWVKKNSIKAYDKQGIVLRVETTINDPHDFKVYRAKEGEPNGPKGWKVLRRGVADLHRRGVVSQEANERYLNALAGLDVDQPLGTMLTPETKPVMFKKRKYRGLRLWEERDLRLIEAVARGEFMLSGFRNKDLVSYLGLEQEDPKRASSRISRLLRILRAHHIIRKVQGQHRYRVTPKGRTIASALTSINIATLQQLTRPAA